MQLSQPDQDAGVPPRSAPADPPSEYLMALEPPDPVTADALPSAAGPAGPAGRADPPQASTRASSTSADADGPAPASTPPGRRGSRLPLLAVSVLAGAALLAAAAFGYLWWDTGQELSETREQRTAEVTRLSDESRQRQQRIDELTDDLRRTAADLARAEQDRDRAQVGAEAAAVLRDADGPVRRCLTGQVEAIEAAAAGDLLAFDALTADLADVCDDADRLLTGEVE